MVVISTKKERTALVVCDLQADLLGSLQERERFLRALSVAVEAARNNGWSVVYSGLRFSPGYEGMPRGHKLYGALAKLNEKLGDRAVHWFMEGWAGSEILSSDPGLAPVPDEDEIVWRSSHVPHELADLLGSRSVSRVYVAGAKASGAVQIACQLLMDRGMEVICVRECIQDDDSAKLKATVDYLLPTYGTVLSLKEFMENVGLDTFSRDAKQILVNMQSDSTGRGHKMFLASDCGRRGHGSRYIELLQQRGNWKTYPTQVWYEDFVKGEFHCPLLRKVVDFCDEPEFSKIAMFLRGRENLDEKDKVIDIAGRFMPKTYRIENGAWIEDEPPPADDAPGALAAPWFVKESDKNLGGAAIAIVSKPSDIMRHVDKNQRYVIQQHISDPLLTDDGRKTHVKFYVLLICEDDGITWNLYTYKGSLLSISPNTWSPADLTHETQVTIHRWPEQPDQTEGWKQHWPTMYEKCKRGTAEVIQKAIKGAKLKGRPGKKQFEVFSVDWMADRSFDIFMLEFNMSPAVSQKEFDDPSSRDSRREYLMKHDELMLKEALAIAMPWDAGAEEAPGQWDFAGTFTRKD
mmetsp:Transcript_35002/g.74668  ORF Transcript_35002/g.74668 Transcript_35002/m.74668 type:complete len:576 (-) Transcript_35002:190-1917(-)|eukprot:CAMPEP_0172551528 /NCGR_PEP_ID=MMETSP1067-20121228/40054_1 /TAXON_ID=265564 ORGANISM="Thalassiosira punctigera, Strain Tpunct2005C2" /NCGR_SAMPLE_ID=MMETSP1067 /ASSEMBLY_ACC=CAM_ASM_000444 /LENGTH=575 /DNA_ID=CAMNT_0013339333 /DNA_START=60 /DNA_END=1787 /DNA_ORIENTATION=-